jgi:hypothetical protein
MSGVFMSDVKTGLMFSPLSEKIYWGKMNVKTGVSVGNNQKDITSDFISIMLQKFALNTRQDITANGKVECVVFVVDEEKARRYQQSKAMFDFLESIADVALDESQNNELIELLAKARGEI